MVAAEALVVLTHGRPAKADRDNVVGNDGRDALLSFLCAHSAVGFLCQQGLANASVHRAIDIAGVRSVVRPAARLTLPHGSPVPCRGASARTLPAAGCGIDQAGTGQLGTGKALPLECLRCGRGDVRHRIQSDQ